MVSVGIANIPSQARGDYDSSEKKNSKRKKNVWGLGWSARPPSIENPIANEERNNHPRRLISLHSPDARFGRAVNFSYSFEPLGQKTQRE